MTARNDIKRKRRRRKRQERWQTDQRRRMIVRYPRAMRRCMAAMFRAQVPLPGDTISGDIAGRYESGAFLGGVPIAPFVLMGHYHGAPFGKWQPVVTPWRIP